MSVGIQWAALCTFPNAVQTWFRFESYLAGYNTKDYVYIYFCKLPQCLCVFFSVRLFSVLRGSFVFSFSSPSQRPMNSDFEGFLSQILSITFIFIHQKEPVFRFSMLSAKQGNYWYHFYNVFGMTRSLTRD